MGCASEVTRYTLGASTAEVKILAIKKHAAIISVFVVICGLLIRSNNFLQAEAQAADSVTIPQYGLFEALLPITSSASNPFDPSQINVTVQFTAPDNTQVNVPAFWMQPYQQTCTK